jgi:hypothetical protein
MSMPAPPDLKGELARLREQELREQFGSFPARTLTWVGALPAWTLTLACQLGLSPDTAAAAGLIHQLNAADLIETKKILEAGGKLTESFWLRVSLRPELGNFLQESSKRLGKDLDDLADAIDALSLEPAAAGSLGSAELVTVIRVYRRDPTGLELIAAIDRLVDRGQLAAANGLVASARGLGELASRPLLDAARRALWRIDRASRDEQDRERLRYYSARPAIEQAIEELMLDPGQTWALHLLGDGGVGKTMLIRYLASGRFTAERSRPRPVLVARADFDHLDPRYPEQRPAELLLALASDLAAFTRTRELYHLYRRFQDAADVLHEARATPRRDDDSGTDLLREAAGQFAVFVNHLEAQVLLVLDTCEELAKLYTPGTSSPAIDETFRLLELVRQQAPSVRVLLAGRRWLVPPGDEGRRASGPLLRPRPYLHVLPVAGFTEAEAEAYVDTRERKRLEEQPASAPLPAELRSALLERSARQSPDGGTYNPFELAAYCEWAANEPGLDAGRLRMAPGDPYVEWRIIGRLGDDQVRSALGIAAELGRFDRALVTPALTRAGIDAKAAFSGLAAQEWVNVLSVGADGRPEVIEVDEHLRDRIRKVTSGSPDRFPLDRPRLGRDALQVIESTPLGELPAETVEAAIRLLPVDAAARLWQRIEERAGEEHAWGWAVQITARAGAVELARRDQQGPESPTILAAIVATQAAARLQTEPGLDPSPLWRKVEREAAWYPDDGERAILLLRARLGCLAAGDLADTSVLRQALQSSTPERESLTGAIVAAAQGCVVRGVDLPGDTAGLLDGLAAAAGVSSAAASAHLASAVLQLWAGAAAAAASACDLAIEIADQAVGGPDRHWADWASPRRLADRCRLVRMIIAWRRGEALDAVPWEAWQAEALQHIEDVDAERLAAATIRFELSHRPVKAEDLERIGRAERYFPERRASAWLHRQVEQLIVELAQAWTVLGEPDRSAGLLQGRREAAVAAGDDPDTIEACELALLKLCRRQRTTAYSSSVHRLSLQGAPRTRSEAWLVRTLVDGAQPKTPEEAGSWSTWWRCQDTKSLASLGSPVPAPQASATEADRAEFAAFFPEPGEAGTNLGGGPPGASHDFDPDEELRLGRDLTLPPGALGRAAVSGAELTALRFPDRALPQLTEAARQLSAAGDELGAEEATLLAGLAAARFDDRPAAEAAWSPGQAAGPARLTALFPLPAWAGWRVRAEAIGAYLDQRPADDAWPPSPEITLPAAGERRSQPGLASLGSTAYGEAVAVGGGTLALAAGLAALGAADIPAFAGTAAFLLVFRIFTAWVLRYRIARARKLEVSQPADGLVAAESVPSRGARDLRGLAPATVIGALAGRWPFWSMFFPWRGRWAHAGPADPAPGFDLEGLKLPGRARSRRLAMIELQMDDAGCLPLPWEQWLGASASAGEASSLLWFRRIAGRPPVLDRGRWRLSGAAYNGPKHLAPDGEKPPRHEQEPALRLLYLVATPVPTAAGWRLRVSDARTRASTESRGKAAGEDLLSIDSFPLSRTALAVLQADPVDGPPRPLADLRPGFAGCVRDLLDGGVGAVLLIPPLPDRVGQEVIHAVWRMVANRRGPLPPTSLIRLLARVKSRVAAAQEETDSGERAALDVLLFLRTPTGDAAGTSALA